jgi:hypothetical protein
VGGDRLRAVCERPDFCVLFNNRRVRLGFRAFRQRPAPADFYANRRESMTTRAVCEEIAGFGPFRRREINHLEAAASQTDVSARSPEKFAKLRKASICLLFIDLPDLRPPISAIPTPEDGSVCETRALPSHPQPTQWDTDRREPGLIPEVLDGTIGCPAGFAMARLKPIHYPHLPLLMS